MEKPIWKKQPKQTASPLAIDLAMHILKMVEQGMAGPDTVARACDQTLKKLRLPELLQVLTAVVELPEGKSCEACNSGKACKCLRATATLLRKHLMKGVVNLPLPEYRASYRDHFIIDTLVVFKRSEEELQAEYLEEWKQEVAAGHVTCSLPKFVENRIAEKLAVDSTAGVIEATSQQISRSEKLMFPGLVFWLGGEQREMLRDLIRDNVAVCPIIDSGVSGVVGFVVESHAERINDLLNAGASEAMAQRMLGNSE